jgi:hypothetical protein
VSQSSRIELPPGALNGADRLTIELVEPPDLPPMVAINWPASQRCARQRSWMPLWLPP